MIGFFKLFILVLLILIEIIIIDRIFNTINLKKGSTKNYSKKLLLKSVMELLVLLIFIFVLVTKYLQNYGVSGKDSVNIALIISFLVVVIFVFQNQKELNHILQNGFSNIEAFTECKADEKDVPYLDKGKTFSLVPAIYRDTLSYNDRFRIACKYPFYIADNIDLKLFEGECEQGNDCEDDEEEHRLDIAKYLTILDDEVFDEHDKDVYSIVIQQPDSDEAKFYF